MHAHRTAAPDGYLTTAEVAQLLEVDRGWIYENIDALADQLQPVKVGSGPQTRLAFPEALVWRYAHRTSFEGTL